MAEVSDAEWQNILRMPDPRDPALSTPLRSLIQTATVSNGGARGLWVIDSLLNDGKFMTAICSADRVASSTISPSRAIADADLQRNEVATRVGRPGNP